MGGLISAITTLSHILASKESDKYLHPEDVQVSALNNHYEKKLSLNFTTSIYR